MLMTVAANGSEAFAEFLLSRGANINARTQSVKDAFCMVMVVTIICSSYLMQGRTVLIVAMTGWRTTMEPMVRFLIDRGADLNPTNVSVQYSCF
jgi:hypothetical protein